MNIGTTTVASRPLTSGNAGNAGSAVNPAAAMAPARASSRVADGGNAERQGGFARLLDHAQAGNATAAPVQAPAPAPVPDHGAAASSGPSPANEPAASASAVADGADAAQAPAADDASPPPATPARTNAAVQRGSGSRQPIKAGPRQLPQVPVVHGKATDTALPGDAEASADRTGRAPGDDAIDGTRAAPADAAADPAALLASLAAAARATAGNTAGNTGADGTPAGTAASAANAALADGTARRGGSIGIGAIHARGLPSARGNEPDAVATISGTSGTSAISGKPGKPGTDDLQPATLLPGAMPADGAATTAFNSATALTADGAATTALAASAAATASSGTSLLSANAADPAAATAGRLTAAPGSADFAPQLGAQISTFVRNGVQHARLELNPAEMGPLTVQIRVDAGVAAAQAGGSAAPLQAPVQVHVHLAADHAQTRQALEQAMPALAGSLREAGLTLSGGGVFEQPRQPQQPGADSGGAAGRNARSAGDTGTDEPGLPVAAAGLRHASRARGVVDLVA